MDAVTKLTLLLSVVALFHSAAAEYGNVCFCACSGETFATELAPFESCHGCSTSHCAAIFPLECSENNQIVLHCLNRSGILVRLAAGSALAISGIAVTYGLMKNIESFLFLKRKLFDYMKIVKSFIMAAVARIPSASSHAHGGHAVHMVEAGRTFPVRS